MKHIKNLFCLAIIIQIAIAIEPDTRSDPFAKFCWRDSYGRGVGKIPTECPDKDKIGLLCYTKCPSGY